MTGPSRQRQDNKRDQHGVTRDNRGEVQPTDKRRARQTSQDDEPSEKQGEQPPSPGQPAGGE